MDPLGFGKDVEKSTNSVFRTARNFGFGTVHSVPEKTVGPQTKQRGGIIQKKMYLEDYPMTCFSG